MKTNEDYLREAWIKRIGKQPVPTYTFVNRDELEDLCSKVLDLQREDFERGLKEQKEFYEWASSEGWRINTSIDIWGNIKPKDKRAFTTEELLTQFWKETSHD